MPGKEAIRAEMKDFVTDPKFSLDLVTAKVAEKGKYVEVYKKQADGSWKIVEDIHNADAPAKPVK